MITILIPCYNEQENISLMIEKLESKFNEIKKSVDEEFSILIVDDGSTDRTLEIVKSIISKNINYISLSRNFGKEVAITAGLNSVKTDAVIIMDADFQHPIDLIYDMIIKYKEGYDNVYAKRVNRKENVFRKFIVNSFYKYLNKNSESKIIPNAGDFRLMNKKVVNAINSMEENFRYMKGIYSYVGFKTTYVEYEANYRKNGKSKFTFLKLFNLGLDGITSFTTIPLKVSTFIGTSISIIAFIYAIQIAYEKVIIGIDVSGYSSIMVSMLFLCGIQLMCIGIIGEYVGRNFIESKKRPLYFVNEKKMQGDTNNEW